MNTDTHSGRHPVNIGHLVMGVAFAGLVVIWAIVQADLVETDEIRWLMPAPWVLAGAVGLVAATLTARRRNQPTFAEPSYAEASYAADITDETAPLDVPEATAEVIETTTDTEEQK